MGHHVSIEVKVDLGNCLENWELSEGVKAHIFHTIIGQNVGTTDILNAFLTTCRIRQIMGCY